MECRNCGKELDPEEGFLVVKRVENGLERELEDMAFCGYGCLLEHLDTQPLTVKENW